MLDSFPPSLIRLAASIAEDWPWLARQLNTAGINTLCNVARHRPHPWSTVHDYTSWRSLTDLGWSARHLPAYRDSTRVLPPASEAVGLFRRRAPHQIMCSKSTFLFPTFAQYLTDGFMRTRMPNTSAGESDQLRRQNTSNHHLDMCPLYGRTYAQTLALRSQQQTSGRRGRLKSQMLSGDSGEEEYSPFLFHDDGLTIKPEFDKLDGVLGIDKLPPERRARLFAFGGDRANSTPQIAMINTLFLREHNRIAGVIERQNPSWDDERVFETARNVVIVLFLKIVVEEYINHISPHIRFAVDPCVAWNASWNKPNWVTAEFSLLYRWHSLVPDVVKWSGASMPVHTTFMNNDLLIQAGLRRAFVDVSSQQAGRLGAFNTPEALLPIEAAGLEQGRTVELAPFGHYRHYVGLNVPATFGDVTPNADAAAFLKSVYRSPGDIEFYLGIFAEETVPNSPLPPLILRMVALDAFSQAFTNPLISEWVFRPETFSSAGWEAIQQTRSLEDIVIRNGAGTSKPGDIRMTLPAWRPS